MFSYFRCQTVWVSAGLHDFCESELNKNAQDRFVKTVYPPDNYNQTTLEADYVVIEFDEDFELDPTHVMPACMPSGPPGAGDIGTVSGWGQQSGKIVAKNRLMKGNIYS